MTKKNAQLYLKTTRGARNFGYVSFTLHFAFFIANGDAQQLHCARGMICGVHFVLQNQVLRERKTRGIKPALPSQEDRAKIFAHYRRTGETCYIPPS